MKNFGIAILGCGTVGGGTAKIILSQGELLSSRAGKPLEIVRILDKFPDSAAKRHGIPRSLFAGTGAELSQEELARQTASILEDPAVDLVVETVGGTSDSLHETMLAVLRAGKHLVTANKAMLAQRGSALFREAEAAGKVVGFEAAVCGAIPVIKGITECMTGDAVTSVAGIMNGTSNYILSNMTQKGMSFAEALKGAQEKGYAEADPTLDVNGGDAGHKLLILLKLLWGIDAKVGDFPVLGIDTVTAEDTGFAREVGSVIKLICHARRGEDGVYATVRPMLVREGNVLSGIGGATNAVSLKGCYSGDNVLIGQGAGSLETGSAIVSDIAFIARYGQSARRNFPESPLPLLDFAECVMPYAIIFDTEDVPGITGLVTTAIGAEGINIDTVSHNLRSEDAPGALFAITAKPCTLSSINRALEAIRKNMPESLLAEPKVIPVLS